jgi:hypothetical protein
VKTSSQPNQKTNVSWTDSSGWIRWKQWVIDPLDVDEGWMDGLVILEMKKNNPQLSTIIINGLPVTDLSDVV